MVSFMVVVSLVLPFFGSMLPLAGGVMALALTSAVCVALTSGAWYGFIAFLIYITGLLVLFGYLLVVNPNTLTGTRFWFLAALLVPLKITQGASFSNSSGKVAELYEGGLVFYLFVSGLLFVVLVLTVVVSFKARKPMRSFLWPLMADLKSASEASVSVACEAA